MLKTKRGANLKTGFEDDVGLGQFYTIESLCSDGLCASKGDVSRLALVLMENWRLSRKIKFENKKTKNVSYFSKKGEAEV